MKSERNIYLKMKSLSQARDILFRAFPRFGSMEKENIPAPDAVGRVLAEPVFARISSPPFHAAAMDGIAVKAENTFGASENRPKKLCIGKEVFYVNTGHVLPEETDAVIMIEQVHIIDDDHLEIEAPVFPWQYVRKTGEDIVATELIFPRNHKISPYCVGALLGGGVFSVPVRKKPRVLIIPTGAEMKDWQDTVLEKLRPGQIIESNSHVLGKMTEECGGEYVRHSIMPDDLPAMARLIQSAAETDYDIVLTVGGSSAGSEDYGKGVILSLGEVLVHGVTMMPGKPVLIGRISGKPVIGIPGYPVSMIMAFEQFVRPLICRFLGQTESEREKAEVETGRKIPSKLGMEEFLRVRLGQVGERIVANPLPRGAGNISSITEADGIIRIPAHSEGIREHETVSAELLRPLSHIRNTLVITGSHDNSLDLLADHLRVNDSRLRISSSHVGSMGGLMALRRGVCHMAGSHLLDTSDGSYNLSYVRRFLPDTKVRIVHLVFRDQGLILAPGNPKHIRGIGDLKRKDIRFVNRQSGSGTRILLDYRLQQLQTDPAEIQGYENEEFTHMSVAVAVLSGAADAGLGIYAAAKALQLDFIPVVTEEYDLIIPEIYFDTEAVQVLMETIRSPVFQERVRKLGGYSTEKTGEIIL